MTPAYYNEIDPYASAWLRNLADAGHVAPGHIDDRSIADVRPDDLGDGQAHFFAGIGGWSLALRLAGVPDDAWVWTGSCPCQPFSTAGRGKGANDERHLWPAWYRLIAEHRPPVVFGEQVASKAGRQWLAAVRADLEDLGYAVGGADLCAASIGAPHIRQRLWWVAYGDGFGRRPRRAGKADVDGPKQPARRGEAGRCWLGHPNRVGTGRHAGTGARSEAPSSERRVVARRDGDGAGASGAVGRLGHGIGPRLEGHAWHGDGDAGRSQADGSTAATGPWGDVEWVDCADGKRRPVEPGTFPLAHGVPGRVGRLRAYGNAIVPQLAAAFIVSALNAIQETA